jgi:hypothetical protein
MSDIHVYGAMSDGEVGIILALPEDSTIRNPEGATVPGIVLTPREARALATQLVSQVEQMEARNRR